MKNSSNHNFVKRNEKKHFWSINIYINIFNKRRNSVPQVILKKRETSQREKPREREKIKEHLVTQEITCALETLLLTMT